MEYEKFMMSIKEVAERTGLSYFCLRRLCLTNQIIYIRSGAKYYINYTNLLVYLNQSHKAEPM